MYDYLVVGAGLFGAIFAYEANKRGKKVLVIDKRSHIGGNIYCEKMEDINVHNTVHIFSIPTTKKYGNISISLQSSTTISTHPLPFTKMNYITCLST